jgi:hypothetical protein
VKAFQSNEFVAGYSVNNFTIIKEVERCKRNRRQWLCLCRCGNQKVCAQFQVGNPSSTCCQKCFPRGSNHVFWQGFKDLSGSFISNVLKKDRKQGLISDIDAKYCWELLNEQEYKCALSGMPIAVYDKTASIDRIDNSYGHVRGNIRWTHVDVNYIKNKMSDDELLQICSLINNPTSSGNYRGSTQRKTGKWNGCGDLGYGLFNRYKINARVRQIEFNLSIEQLWEKFIQQDYRCAYTGLILSFGNCYFYGTASLDRIDSITGYCIDNVEWVYKPINSMKLSLNKQYFIELCKKIVWKLSKKQS